MTNTDKMTNRKALQFVLDNYDVPADEQEVIKNMITAIDKTSDTERRPSARQIANENIKSIILEQMELNALYDIQTMLMTFDGLSEMSTQRMCVLLKQLIDEGKIVRTVDKRKTYFNLAQSSLKVDREEIKPTSFSARPSLNSSKEEIKPLSTSTRSSVNKLNQCSSESQTIRILFFSIFLLLFKGFITLM